MNPLTHLLLAAALFLATHYLASTPLRAKLVAALGKAYLGLFSLVAFATLGYMTWAYYRAPFINLWYAVALHYVPLIVMPFALLLVVCGLLTRNPTLVGQEDLLKSGDPVQGILRVTRHPLMWGFALWAASHIAARGDVAALVFFSTFLLLALSGTVLIDRRKAATLGEDWQRYAAVTSNLPFAAIAAGRNRFKPGEIGWINPVVAVALYVLLLGQHADLFGASPLFFL